MEKQYAVYKGLQKPLVFRGFKGRFIYWGIASLLLGLVAGALTMALVSMWAGALVLSACILGGLFYTGQKQKKGLYNRSRRRGIFVHPVSLKNIKYHASKNAL